MKLVHALALSTALAFSGAALAEHGGKHDGKSHGEHFKKADTNGDGVLSKEEFIQSAEQRAEKKFDKIDANDDGKVGQDEMKTHHEAMKEKFKERKAAGTPAAK